MAEMTIKERKEWAQLSFIKEDLTQKEIALKVGVSEQTLSKWVNTEGWEKMRISIIKTKGEEIVRLYRMLRDANNEIEEAGRAPNSKEMDVIIKLTGAIKNLESETSLAQIIDVFKAYFDWLRPVDLPESQKQIVFADSFIKSRSVK
jgi:uncharacterized protein YjcR